ncbi:MAG TPA: hypothetical protein VM204_04525 [Gaiellaceae bacterium]|nr:hypothetical protein [Gaiellaceae bacterium]
MDVERWSPLVRARGQLLLHDVSIPAGGNPLPGSSAFAAELERDWAVAAAPRAGTIVRYDRATDSYTLACARADAAHE